MKVFTNNAEIRFYYDTLIVEAVLSPTDGFYKKADGGLLDTFKNYISGHIDLNDDNKAGKILNLLVPGVLSTVFGGGIGKLLGFAYSMFHIDISEIFNSIKNKIKPLISGDKKTTSFEVDQIVHSSIQSQAGSDANNADQIQTASLQQELKDAKIISLALVSYEKQIMRLTKEANFVSYSASMKGKLLQTLGKVISWLFKVGLASAGFMVAGDVANKVLDRPNAIDGNLKDGKPAEQVASKFVSKQTKFPLKSNFVDTQYNFSGNNWIEQASNSHSGIENMLISFAKEIYDGLDGQENVIKSSSIFQEIVRDIAWYNHAAVGDPIVFLPKKFVSKKHIVDFFIDDVANLSKSISSLPIKPQTPSKPPMNLNEIKPDIDRGQRIL